MTKPIILSLFLPAALAVGCGHKDTIAGKWQGVSAQGGGARAMFEFTPDGKESIQIQGSMGPTPITMAVSGTYAVSGSQLTQTLTTMTMNGKTFPVPAHKAAPQPFTLDGDRLTLTSPGTSQTTTLTRVKG